jgi:hypothetical protein
MFADLSPDDEETLVSQIFRNIPIIILVFGAIISSSRLRKGTVYWYVLSSSLVIFVAAIPYTGWILGYFVSARMLSRVSWFAPYGLAAVLVIQAVTEWLKLRSIMSDRKLSIPEGRGLMLGLTASLLFVGPFLLFSLTQRLPKYFQVLEHNRQITDIGAFIDKNTETYTTVIATDYKDLQLLPTASAHASLISFREELEYNGFNNFLPIDVVRERIAASTAIRFLDLSEKKCLSLRKYEVQYVLVPLENELAYTANLQNCDVPFKVILHTKDYVLLKNSG